jgi:hypothetical protein
VRLGKSSFVCSVRGRSPLGIVIRDRVPEFDQAHQFSVLIGADQVGPGTAEAAAFLLQSEQGLDAGAGLTAARDLQLF